ncbi:hypothetical tRNA/rRNA methyltransferase yfiF [Pseudoalteromonas luteoviolacea B = ATCC 29581]|nr:hypothetical tRNA/rRNA methyltransferase yfiF [Pseudoalteromonas luteoviolacea B = ATCC 29581]
MTKIATVRSQPTATQKPTNRLKLDPAKTQSWQAQAKSPEARPVQTPLTSAKPSSGQKSSVSPQQPTSKKSVQDDELKIYGVNSCLAFFSLHPSKLVRAYLSEAAAKGKFKALVKWFVTNKKAYHVVSDLELEKVTESKHHEGVCLLVKAPEQLELASWLTTLPAKAKGAVLMLDRVANPHNLGAIMRVAAHYGVIGIVTCNPSALRSGSAMRTSEGGAMYVPILKAKSMEQAVKLLKAEKFYVMATSSHHSHDLYQTKLPARSAFILGEESNGIDPVLATISDKNVIVQGTGKVESLNVSVATALLCSEYWRQHLPK